MGGMIGFIEGIVKWKDERSLIVLVSGVGYVLSGTPQLQNSAKVGGEVALWTHLAVREDALDLYGFQDRDELLLFRLLIGISGIGPKSAMNVLSLADRATLVHAIQKGDATYLTKVSGIGKKLAEKIVLGLKDKVAALSTMAVAGNAESEALDALEALGYLPRDTREIVRLLTKDHETPEEIIRRALQILGGRI